jgi:hypothetical protein
MSYKLVEIVKSSRQGKKFKATFLNKETGRSKTVHFGASGMSDYTEHHDKERRQRYLDRHSANENWNDPTTAGSLSRWILWGDSTSFDRNLAAFKRKFSL